MDEILASLTSALNAVDAAYRHAQPWLQRVREIPNSSPSDRERRATFSRMADFLAPALDELERAAAQAKAALEAARSQTA